MRIRTIQHVIQNSTLCFTSACHRPVSTHLCKWCRGTLCAIFWALIDFLVIFFKDNGEIFSRRGRKVWLFVPKHCSIAIITGFKRQQRNDRKRWMELVNKPSFWAGIGTKGSVQTTIQPKGLHFHFERKIKAPTSWPWVAQLVEHSLDRYWLIQVWV